MKKFILSASVIIVFLAYSYYQRHESAGPAVATLGTAGSSPSVQSSKPGTGRAASSGLYKDGTYTGSVADAFYGLVQVRATVSGGKLTAVQFLEYPSDNPNSRAINGQAMPVLQQEAIQAQSAHVDTVTGATDTSLAFVQSLTAALAHAG